HPPADVQVRTWAMTKLAGERRPRCVALRGCDAVPDSDRDEVAVGLVALAARDPRGSLERRFLGEDPDIARECPDRSRVGDVELPDRPAGAAVEHLSRSERGDDPKAQE